MSVFTSILCAVDFSEASQAAVRVAAAVAARERARLTVCTVLHPLLAEAAAYAFKLDPGAVAAETRAELATFVGTILPGEPSPALEVLAGDITGQILGLAGKAGHDLIVVGTAALSGYRKLFYGSTAHEILKQTTVAVLLVSRREGAPALPAPSAASPILAAIDKGEDASPHVGVARSLAASHGRPIVLLHVAAEPADAAGADVEREARRWLTALAASLSSANAPVQSELRFGDPADEIVAAADEHRVGLVVMALQRGGRRRSPGAIAYRVLCGTHVPVLTIPPR